MRILGGRTPRMPPLNPPLGTTCGEGITYPSGAHRFTPGLFMWSTLLIAAFCVILFILIFLCLVFFSVTCLHFRIDLRICASRLGIDCLSILYSPMGLTQCIVHNIPLLCIKKLFPRICLVLVFIICKRYNWDIVESGVKHQNPNPHP